MPLATVATQAKLNMAKDLARNGHNREYVAKKEELDGSVHSRLTCLSDLVILAFRGVREM